MRVLWVGDSPTVSTGFARCTRHCCAELVRAGHDVFVLGINASGDPHRYPYDIFPAQLRGKGDVMGIGRLPALIDRLKPDVVIILQDPWNIPPYFEAMDELCQTPKESRPPVVGWLAVDARNHPGSKELNRLAHVITWTKFGISELREGGYDGSSSIVPLGVDLGVFRPLDRQLSRAAVLPESHCGKFVIGVVGRNQPRKRIDLAIGYFAEFLKRYNADAYLYLHVSPTGERACDVRMVAAYYGEELVGRILMSSPDVANQLSDEHMARVYNSFDVLLTTTQGEGWGLTVHEAMACGVPCLVPEWSALGEWAAPASLSVPCTSTALSAPQNFFPYTIGGVPDKDATVRALWAYYGYKENRREMAERGLELTRQHRLQWGAVARCLRYELEGVVASAELPREERGTEIQGVGEGAASEDALPTTESLQLPLSEQEDTAVGS